MVSLDALTSAVTYLDTFCIGLLNPLMPTLLRSDLIGARMYSMLVSASNAAALVAGTSFGRLSDVLGRRAAIFASVLCSLFGYVCFALACASDNVYPRARLILPAVGRVLAGVGRAALSAPLLALLAERAGRSAATRVAASMATFGFGYASGSGLGGVLSRSTNEAALPVALVLLCSLLQLGCACSLPRGAHHRPSSAHDKTSVVAKGAGGAARARSHSWLASLQLAMAVSSTRTVLLLQLLSAASFQVYSATSAIYLKEHLGYSSAQLGYILSFAGWAFALQTHVVHRLCPS